MTQAPQFDFSDEIAANLPDEMYVLVTMDGQTWIQLPSSGTLCVVYEYADQPATAVFIWHQGGAMDTVPPGISQFQINATDCLVYELADPQQSIKLGWAYMS